MLRPLPLPWLPRAHNSRWPGVQPCYEHAYEENILLSVPAAEARGTRSFYIHTTIVDHGSLLLLLWHPRQVQHIHLMQEEIVAWVRRRSSAFSRGRSRFRGVSGQAGHWEARIGTFGDRKNVREPLLFLFCNAAHLVQ